MLDHSRIKAYRFASCLFITNVLKSTGHPADLKNYVRTGTTFMKT